VGTRTTFRRRLVEARLTPDGKSKLGDCWAVSGGSTQPFEWIRPDLAGHDSLRQSELDGLLIALADDLAGQPDEAAGCLQNSSGDPGLAGDLAKLAELEAAATAAAVCGLPGGHPLEAGDDEPGWWSGSEPG
jgi:hypothetical protein